MHAHALVRREHEEALGDADDGLVDLDEVLLRIGVEIVEGARNRAPAEADHEDALGFGIHEQAGEHHSDVGKNEPIRILQVDARLIAVRSSNREQQASAVVLLAHDDIAIERTLLVDDLSRLRERGKRESEQQDRADDGGHADSSNRRSAATPSTPQAMSAPIRPIRIWSTSNQRTK